MSEWKYIECVLCASRDHKYLYSKTYKANEYRIMQCPDCGIVFVNPQPPDDLLKDFYDNDLYSEEWLSQFPDRVNSSYFEDRSELAVKGYEVYKERILKYITGGRILDVGCGDGAFLRLFGDEWEKHGLDVSKRSYDYLNDHDHRIKFYYGTLFDVDLKNEFYDVVVSMDTIEHVKDPLSFLKKIANVLKSGGIVCIHTINIESGEAKRDRENWLHLTPPGHLFYFSPKTVRYLFRKAGLKIMNIDMRLPLFTSHNVSLDPENSTKESASGSSGKIREGAFNPVKAVLQKVYDVMSQLKGKLIGRPDITIYAMKG